MALKIVSVLLDILSADPGSPGEGELWYASDTGKHRRKDADGVHSDTDLRVSSNDTTPAGLETKLPDGDGVTFTVQNEGGNETLKAATSSSSPGPHRFSISPSEMLTSGTSHKVEANDYAAIEFSSNITDYASYSMFWRRAPTSNALVRVKFVLKQSGSGTKVRIAGKLKARATGEDSTTAFDASVAQAVTVTTTTIGEVFQAQLSFSNALFADGDAIALHIGRDGAEEIAGGDADDYSKPIQVIAIELEVP